MNKSEIFRVRLSPAEAERLDKLAASEDLTRSAYIRRLIRDRWNRRLRLLASGPKGQRS